MPSHLRQCFTYCSMLSKGQEIPREVFINRWIAQGFIQSSNRNKQLEDIGNQYFDELLSRFCFLDVQAFDGEILSCKIHNLVCLNVKSNASVVSERVRHLFFHAEDMSRKHFPRFLLPLQKLISFSYSFNVGPVNKFFVKTVSSNFKCLWMLVLNNLDIEELPASIFASFQVSFPKIAARTGAAFECSSLCSLPSSIRYLTSLEKLWIWNCEELDLMDGEGMSGLTRLQSLLLMGLPKLVTLPLGLKNTAPATFKYFRIADCPNLAELPEWLPNCASLQRLYAEDCPVLASIPQGIDNHNANVHIVDCPLLGE